jgi:hypothetical protein
MNRRDFLRTLALGALAGLVALLARRRCTNAGVCEKCRLARDCGLPAAQLYRNKGGG